SRNSASARKPPGAYWTSISPDGPTSSATVSRMPTYRCAAIYSSTTRLASTGTPRIRTSARGSRGSRLRRPAAIRTNGSPGIRVRNERSLMARKPRTYATLDITRRNGVGIVMLNRPEVHNAFNEVVVAELTAATVELGEDEGVRAIILAGNGPSFCAGAD